MLFTCYDSETQASLPKTSISSQTFHASHCITKIIESQIKFQLHSLHDLRIKVVFHSVYQLRHDFHFILKKVIIFEL